jgi:stage V sporulation protein G
MEITSIIIRRISLESKMKAIVSITFDNAFVVHDVKVIEGTSGLFIAMPSRRTQEGDFKDIVHPIHSEFREELSRAVLEKYQAALSEYMADLPHREERTHAFSGVTGVDAT